mgnify:CR=1 FL=1
MTWQDIFYITGTLLFVSMMIFILSFAYFLIKLKQNMELKLEEYKHSISSFKPMASLTGNLGLIWSIISFFRKRR